jgi:autotransporter-associated beta strand protein
MSIMRSLLNRAVRACTIVAVASIVGSVEEASAQRLLGIDISAWQDNISSSNWTTLHNTNDRDFVFIRSSRGGTTGFDHNHDNILSSNANCNGVSTDACLARRYDDPYFGQNITRATNEGLFAGSYHRSRADVIAGTPNTAGIANTGADEATHMMQMAGAWMRPGYLPPVLDFEDGETARTDQEMAQFALDFSNRIYEVMQIRPAIYVNGNYAQNVLGGGTPAQRAELAQQSSNPPSVVSPAFPTLWNARWPNQGDPNSIDVQNLNPTVGFANIYGPWDDYGVTHPWAFWQYASTARLSGYKNGGANIDVNVSKGDIEFVKDQLIPALWWNDSSGDWSTLANWNSGQPLNTYNTSLTFDQQPLPAPYIPPVFPNMTAVQGSTTLPTPRLPGAAGSGPTSGQHDTVILDRPSADITVTLSTGSHNIRKLYVRETFDIVGGTLTVNYDPNYAVPVDGVGNPLYPNAVRSGPLSAQFSGAVSLSGTGSLSVHTLQVDSTRTFTLGGGTLTFNTINLVPDDTTPAKISLTGDVNITPLSNATATIANGLGGGDSGLVDLGGGNRAINVGNGAQPIDLAVNVPITNGGLIKNGNGTIQLGGDNTLAGPVTINAGTLKYGHPSGLSSSSVVTVDGGGALDMNGLSDSFAGLVGSGAVQQGSASLALGAASGTHTFSGIISGNGPLTKSGNFTQILSGNNNVGPINLNAGELRINNSNTSGSVSVNGGTLSGFGSVSGAVTVGSGGHVAPGVNDIAPFGVGGMTLEAGSVLDLEIQNVSGVLLSDQINVGQPGGLTLNGGTINIVNAGLITDGVYKLINYSGTLNGSLANLELGTTPGGDLEFELVDSGTSIDLVASYVMLDGDFNSDFVVDAADYVVWRKGSGVLPTPDNYNIWRTNFGRTAGGGSASNATVPEPAGALLSVLGAAIGLRFLTRSKTHWA